MNREAFQRFHKRLTAMFSKHAPVERKYQFTIVSLDSPTWDKPPSSPGTWKMLSCSVQGYQMYVLWENEESSD